MIEKNKIYSKYLDKNQTKSIYRTSNPFQLYNKTKIKHSDLNNKIVIHDELDPLDENIYENYGDEYNPTVINPNNNEIVNIKEEERKTGNLKPTNTTKWIEMNEGDPEDHEDEIRALQKAKNEYDQHYSDSEDDKLRKKRKRHDTDDENSEKEEIKYNTEDELDELLPQQDEDGDIILEPKPNNRSNVIKNGLISLNEYKINKTINKNIFDEISKKPLINNTIYRDKEGRIIKPGETKEEKQKKLKELNEKQLRKWMKGIKQAEDRKKQEENEKVIKNEPLARYEIDESVEDELKNKERFGDPLKQLINFKNLKGKEQNEDTPETISQQNHLLRNLDPDVKKKKIRRKCKFKAPPNRYGIESGYMWDGVDRGNGFEQRLLASRNISNAQKNEYYKLRTEEM